MEIPTLDSGITRLQSPSLLLYVKLFWAWGALVLATIATFRSLIRKSKRVLCRLGKVKSVISLPNYSYSSDEDDDASSSSSSDDEYDDVDEDSVSVASEKDFGDFERIQGQNGEYDHKFSLSELARDGHVVKFWDGFGLGYDRSTASLSLVDLNRDETVRSFLWGFDEAPAVHVADNGTVKAAGKCGGRAWDARATVDDTATWRADGVRNVAGFSDEKVYYGDDVDGVRVVDLRRGMSALRGSWLL